MHCFIYTTMAKLLAHSVTSSLTRSTLTASPPPQVVRCALENAASVAKTFLTSDVVVTEIKGE